MLVMAFIRWWYGPGWMRLARHFLDLISRIDASFSVPLLLATLFAPWRRIISYGDRSFVEGLKAALDNAVSRLVGFSVRIIVITAALVCMLLAAIAGVVASIMWPLLPPGGIMLIIFGLFN